MARRQWNRNLLSTRGFTLASLTCAIVLAGCPTTVPIDPVEEPDPSPELPIVMPTPDAPEPGTAPEQKEPEPAPIEPDPAPADAGQPDDAGQPPADAGQTPVDAGQPPVDAGQPPVDAGQPPVDAGPPPVDAGFDAGPLVTCGDNTIDGTDVCDGTDVGTASCRAFGFGGGILGCKSACDDYDSSTCAPLVPTSIPAPGTDITLNGSLDASDPSFSRPSTLCTAGSTAGYFFDAHALRNDTGAQQEIQLEASWPGDGFLLRYSTPFDPRVVTGCTEGNDDTTTGATTSSRLSSVILAPGETIVVVTTSYDAADAFGAYSLLVATQAIGAVCPNNTLESGEVCDGTDLGIESCVTQGFDSGTLACAAACDAYVTTGCANDPPPPPTAIATPGNGIVLGGALTDDDDKWIRVNADCTSSGGASDHAFDAHAIVNSTGQTQNITLTATWSGADGYLGLFTDPFDAAAATASCVIADDDFNGTTQSQIVSAQIPAGAVMWVVSTTFAGNAEIASYTINVETDPLSVCGDNVIEGDEVCDGTDLGAQVCTSLGFTNGTLGCNGQCTGLDALGCFDLEGPFAVPAPGTADVFSGSLTPSDTVFDRPGTSCAAGTGAADHAYDVWEVRNDLAEDLTFIVTGSFTGGTGSVLRYATFDPRSPTTGCTTFTGTSLTAMTLAPGESTLLVVAAATGGGTVSGYSITLTTDFNEICGNDFIGGDEVCDGTALAGVGCLASGFDGGINACLAGCGAYDNKDCFDFQSFTSIGAPGATVNVTGSLDASDPRIDRPGATCADFSLYDSHPFDAFVLENNTGAPQLVTLTADWSGDGYLHIYDAFDSAEPFAGCITGDDDFGITGSQIEELLLPAGAQVVVLASTYAESPIGSYTIGIETLLDPALPLRATPGLSVQLRGDITAATPEWNRPLASCGSVSGVATAERFQSFRVQNTTASDLIVTLTAHWQEDGYLMVYDSTFDSAAPLTGCVTGDDDFSDNTETLSSRKGSRVEDLTIPAGAERIIVASSFGDTPSAIGPYSIDITTDVVGTDPIVVNAAPIGSSIITTGTVGYASSTWDAPDTCSYVATPANTTVETFYSSAFLIENAEAAALDLDIIVSWLDAGADGAVWAFVYTDPDDPTDDGAFCIGSNLDLGGPGMSALQELIFPGEVIAIIPTSEDDGIAPGGYLLEVASSAP